MRFVQAREIEAAVRVHFKGNGYAVLSEVRNGTGFTKVTRTADMIVASTWPSRGLALHGIEIKVSRSDLRKELAEPSKADELARYCDFWCVAMPDDLSRDDLIIPPTWGLLLVSEKGKVVTVPAMEQLKPEPPDKSLVCSILRNFSESHVHRFEIQELIEEARKKERKDAEANRIYRHRDLERGYAQFKEVSGIDLLDKSGHPVWNMQEIGDAVNLLVSLKAKPAEELARLAATLDTARRCVLEAGKKMYPREFAEVSHNGAIRKDQTAEV